jgi:hypothetical protein
MRTRVDDNHEAHEDGDLMMFDTAAHRRCSVRGGEEQRQQSEMVRREGFASHRSYERG